MFSQVFSPESVVVDTVKHPLGTLMLNLLQRSSWSKNNILGPFVSLSNLKCFSVLSISDEYPKGSD